MDFFVLGKWYIKSEVFLFTQRNKHTGTEEENLNRNLKQIAVIEHSKYAVSLTDNFIGSYSFLLGQA